MEYYFTSHKDFNEALSEIDVLLELADESRNDEVKYPLFLKSGILFLATKFESFIEDTVSEYAYKLSQLKFTVSQLPSDILISALNYHISDDFVAQLRQRKHKCKNQLELLAPLLKEGEIIDCITIDHKFSYGKHGSKIIEKLFERIGHYDIFDKCKISIAKESMLSEEPVITELNVSGHINAITGLRNSIIHENKSPNLTKEQLVEYRDSLVSFVDALSSHLCAEIESLSAKKDS